MSVGDLSWWPKWEGNSWVRRFRFPRRRPLYQYAGAATTLILLLLAASELRWSWLQSRILAGLSARLQYGLGAGPSASVATPPAGPYDQRLGYTQLPSMLARLGKSYRISAQAWSSPALRDWTTVGGYPIYPEKAQAGLLMLDHNHKPLFASRYPKAIYPTFDAIPPLVVQSLLYIENRKVLDDDYPYSNPAVEWNRLAKAMGDLALNKVYPAHPISGGSTLATQLEKVRHSPAGRTASTAEKFRQMMAASLRAYRNGENTTQTRREIVRDYINSFPLGAVPGYGEVAGLQEGLLVWFGADPAETNRLLRAADADDPQLLRKQALAYRQVLSLLLALNRPSYYLREDKAALDARTDSFLRLLASRGVISAELSAAALAAQVRTNERFAGAPDGPLAGDKGTLSLRADLLSHLGVPNIYALDRMDLTATSTFDGEVQGRISQELRALSQPGYASNIGLSGSNLLGAQNDGSVIFSFTLYEQSPDANLLRVESDNYSQPLSINRGTRLELGSTAKLRTLVTYLEIVADLHKRYGAAPRAELETARARANDRLSRWALDYLLAAPDASLTDILEAALDRTYSASPAERFFTGGGVHTFSNFDAKDNHSVLPVRVAFRRSVNLVFIRLMRDVVDFYMWRNQSPRVLENPADPARQVYLARFADQESRVFLRQFWSEQQGAPVSDAVERRAAKGRRTLQRLAVIHRSVYPNAKPEDLAVFLRRLTDVPISDFLAAQLHEGYSPAKFSWNDRGYLASIHPLELWTLYFRHSHPSATFTDAVEQSKQVRQEIYEWLFQRKDRAGQNTRIGIVLEQDAFQHVLASWKRQGYPFADIVPSYASALGSSGDNPAALAELAGIILNEGVRKPALRIRNLQFAAGTPYETLLAAAPAPPQRVYPAELARVVKSAMLDVVQNGTARRAYDSLRVGDSPIPIGGKTGTGDNRLEKHGLGGQVIGSRPMSRTATFVFVAGDRFFGTVTAYVPGEGADRFQFTSALPVQLFRHLAPNLKPLLEASPDGVRSSAVHPNPAAAPTKPSRL